MGRDAVGDHVGSSGGIILVQKYDPLAGNYIMPMKRSGPGSDWKKDRNG